MNQAKTKPKEEVQAFLDTVLKLLEEPRNLIILPREKNRNFLRQYDLRKINVIEFLKDLDVSNFNSSEPDDNQYRQGEVWIFGKTLIDSQEFLGSSIIVYIKLQINDSIICISLHEAEHKLTYPYN